MQVFKFGGASVKDAENVKNVASIIANHKKDQLLVVVSATGKSTDKLEEVTRNFVEKTGRAFDLLEQVKASHHDMLTQLFDDVTHPVFNEVANCFVEIEWILEEEPQDSYDYLFDQIVSTGEIVSSKILAAYAAHIGLPVKWVDARDYIFTDNTYREAKVDWEKTEEKISRDLPPILKDYVVISQGFIGSTSENFTTTLGREGSDYSAAIFASCLNATDITIWKDVPGVLNADPKWFDRTELIPELSYTDAIELTYYGATVIHPKTIKPLQNKNIALNVRSFINPTAVGTCIRKLNQGLPIPSFIFKVNQVFINIQPRDFSFILEDNLSHIFNLFHKHRIKINMMHNSAISFSVSIDDTGKNVETLLQELELRYKVNAERGLELITIRYFNQETIDRVLVNKKIIRELKDSYTCQLLVKNL
ncbi:aspartate kinase [Sphingobacterium psychroaquaticum]|uniref:Aspartokinase n=1 Tax=Sphingobacterium psychroaquaticum TaxID=561061 RepID=A0A1X7JTC5_9SPHI|nr:aspartate kinase [Sphingobacterium psychroaquaticum]SMG31632.1 aspartate kinase [Sphingobacterium psychroaquaticum]